MSKHYNTQKILNTYNTHRLLWPSPQPMEIHLISLGIQIQKATSVMSTPWCQQQSTMVYQEASVPTDRIREENLLGWVQGGSKIHIRTLVFETLAIIWGSENPEKYTVYLLRLLVFIYAIVLLAPEATYNSRPFHMRVLQHTPFESKIPSLIPCL